MAIKVAKRFLIQNYTNFHSHYHRLLPPTKRAIEFLHNYDSLISLIYNKTTS